MTCRIRFQAKETRSKVKETWIAKDAAKSCVAMGCSHHQDSQMLQDVAIAEVD